MKRKTWALVLAAAAALSMTACGGSSQPAETTAKAEETIAAQSEKAEDTSSKEEAKDDSAKDASGTVMLYSSMQEDQLVAIKEGFEKKYPNVKMDYYFAGTGKVITKIATEHQSGQVAADVIWVGDPSDYISFK